MSFQQLYDLFDRIVELPTDAERSALIELECSDNMDMKRELTELIQAHFRGNPILESPTRALDLVSGPSNHLEEAEGSLVGNYKLLQKIGEGGMGVVFMAEQLRPIRRKVAVKIIREGMHSKQIMARFEAEREALARLDHPNVTRILDAGVAASGRPFFAMELVRGTHITQFCKTHRIPICERLELLEKVCMVIHHAHQKGILHRDIKPSNVMITLHDGIPIPKVIDFGIAKALDRPLTEQTLFTRYGDLIGTPEYMSPEQAEMSGLDLDVRTDIFSLGVLLYELLTGSTPLTSDQIKGKGLLKIFETIRDSEAEVPSLRVTKTISAVETVSDKQLNSTSSLRKLILGELDWITMKAIAKDRNERYESAAAMAKDIRRHLKGEPVEAAAPTFAYRTRKFYQKHRSVTLVASICTLLLLLSTALSIYWAITSNRQTELVQNQSNELLVKTRELESQKELAEASLARALIAEKRAEHMARNERFKATRTHAEARFFGEETRQHLEEFFVKINENQDSAIVRAAPVATIAIQSNVISEPSTELPRPEIVDGVMPGRMDIQVTNAIRNKIQILTGENPMFSAVRSFGRAQSPIQIHAVTRKMPPRFFELLVEELRNEFGNSDPYVAVALRDFATSLRDDSTADSLVQAENYLREAISILESAPDEAIEQVRTMISLGRVLKLRGKQSQSETILSEAAKKIEQELKSNATKANHEQWNELKAEITDLNQRLPHAISSEPITNQ
jgi:serine/threonine protein kinase